MSTETQEREVQMQDEMEMGTKPIQEHQWLQKLVGNWKTESQMNMPDGTTASGQGHETVKSLGGLWALGEGTTSMPDGSPMEYYAGLGYDVSFKEYRGFKIMSASSHLWKYSGKLSADGRVMTLDCVGPSMTRDGETANYRDVMEFTDDDHWTLTSSGDESGQWEEYFNVRYSRI